MLPSRDFVAAPASQTLLHGAAACAQSTAQSAPPVGRFAPSPTGRMHLGNVFCALLAWLCAKSAGGKIILRIEDLDTARCKTEYATQLLRDLTWLGLTWDAGGLTDAYRQSRCADRYEAALQTIRAAAEVYPCYCTREELHAAGAPHLSDGTILYSGRCRHLTAEQLAALSGRRAALRLAVPDETIPFWDGHYGFQCENLRTQCGDFILRRSDGVYAYQLAVVTDDIHMGVTQIVRGRDLLGSCALQLYLYRLLGAAPPAYFHIPMLCAPDGKRLSKREKSLDLGALRTRYTAPQLVGLLACLAGLVPPGTEITPTALLPLFNRKKLPQADILLDPDLI